MRKRRPKQGTHGPRAKPFETRTGNIVLRVERRAEPNVRYLSMALLTLAQQLLEAEDKAKRRQG